MNNVRIEPSAAVLIPTLAVLLLFTVDAHAAVSNTDMLNGIVEKMQTATQSMADKLVGFATTLFWSLAVINMVITFGFMAMRKADIGEYFAELVRFIITLGFFWWLLSNVVSGMNIGGTIIDSMRNMAAQATGLGRELSPSGIVDVGFNVLFTVYNADLGIADKLLAYAVAVIILLIFAAVAVNMVLVLAESWFLLYGGIFVLGFGGARWTTDIAIGYYRQVLGVGFKLFGMAVIIGVGKGFIDGFLADLSKNPGILELAVILVAAYVFFKLSDRIPSMLASLIPGGGGPGGFAGGGGAVSAGAIAGAAAGVAGAAMTGGASLAAAAAGGAQAVMAAASKGSDNVSAGTDILSSMMGGGDSADTNSSTPAVAVVAARAAVKPRWPRPPATTAAAHAAAARVVAARPAVSGPRRPRAAGSRPIRSPTSPKVSARWHPPRPAAWPTRLRAGLQRRPAESSPRRSRRPAARPRRKRPHSTEITCPAQTTTRRPA